MTNNLAHLGVRKQRTWTPSQSGAWGCDSMPIEDIKNFVSVSAQLATAGQPSEQQVDELARAGFDVVENTKIRSAASDVRSAAGARRPRVSGAVTVSGSRAVLPGMRHGVEHICDPGTLPGVQPPVAVDVVSSMSRVVVTQ